MVCSATKRSNGINSPALVGKEGEHHIATDAGLLEQRQLLDCALESAGIFAEPVVGPLQPVEAELIMLDSQLDQRGDVVRGQCLRIAHYGDGFPPPAQLADEFLPVLAQQRVAAGDGEVIDVHVPLLLEGAEGIQYVEKVAQREGTIPLRRPGERVVHVAVLTAVTTCRGDMPLDA